MSSKVWQQASAGCSHPSFSCSLWSLAYSVSPPLCLRLETFLCLPTCKRPLPLCSWGLNSSQRWYVEVCIWYMTNENALNSRDAAKAQPVCWRVGRWTGAPCFCQVPHSSKYMEKCKYWYLGHKKTELTKGWIFTQLWSPVCVKNANWAKSSSL